MMAQGNVLLVDGLELELSGARSGFKYVTEANGDKGGYQARVTPVTGGVQKHLGHFDSAVDAAKAVARYKLQVAVGTAPVLKETAPRSQRGDGRKRCAPLLRSHTRLQTKTFAFFCSLRQLSKLGVEENEHLHFSSVEGCVKFCELVQLHGVPELEALAVTRQIGARMADTATSVARAHVGPSPNIAAAPPLPMAAPAAGTAPAAGAAPPPPIAAPPTFAAPHALASPHTQPWCMQSNCAQSAIRSTTSPPIVLGGPEAMRCATPLGMGALDTRLLNGAALLRRAPLRAPSPLASGQSRPFSPQDLLAHSASPLLGGGAMRVAPLAPQSALDHANATGMPTVVTPGWQALIHERDGSGSRSRSESPMGAGIPDLGAGGFLHPDVYGQGGF